MISPHLTPAFGIRKDRLLSPFIVRYKCKMELSRLPVDVQNLLHELVVSDDEKLAFYKNTKAGCTSIAHIIYQYSNGHPFSGSIHKDNKNISQGILHWEKNLATIQNGNPFLFSFVRHPEKRLVSAFRNFFVDRSNFVARRHFKAMQSFGYRKNGDLQHNFDVFLDYVRASMDIDPLRTDPHWRSQNINLATDSFKYDFIGKLENFDTDIENVFKLAGIDDFDVGKIGQTRKNRTKPTPLTISDAQREKIIGLYARDYKEFGYSEYPDS